MNGEPAESICRRLGLTTELLDPFPDRLQDSELGEIPEGWTIAPISDLAEIVGGGTPSTKNTSFWIEGQHFWATPKDLSNLKEPVELPTPAPKGIKADLYLKLSVIPWLHP